MASVDSAAPEQLDFVGSLLVADTRAFVEEWRAVLSGDPSPTSAPVSELRERSKTLQLRARAAGVGGLAHHLGVCNECCEAWDREGLERCLGNVLELAWQLSQEVERGRPEPAAGAEGAVLPASESREMAHGSSSAVEPRLPVQPPPLLHSGWRGWKRLATGEAVSSAVPSSPSEPVSGSARREDEDEDEEAPPTLVTESPVPAGLTPALVAAESAPPTVAASVQESTPPTLVTESPVAASPPPALVAAESAPPTVSKGLAENVPPTVLESVAESALSAPVSADLPVALPALVEGPTPPPLLVDEQTAADDDDLSEPVPSSRSVFTEPVLETGWLDDATPAPPMHAKPGRPPALPPELLRPEPPRPGRIELVARAAAPAPARAPARAPAPVASPAPASEPAFLSPLTEAPVRPAEPPALSDGAAALSEVLGLTPLGESVRLVSERAIAAARLSPAPQSPLPQSAAPQRLAPDHSGLPLLEADSVDEDELTDEDLEIRLERVRRAAPFPLGRGEVAIELPPPSEPRERRRPPRARLAWWVTPLALGVFGGLALLALLLRPWRTDTERQSGGEPRAVTRSEALLPVQRLTDDREVKLALLSLVQGGGKESNELSDLIREEVALVAAALTEPCLPGSPSCRIAEQARQMLEQPPLPKPAAREPSMPGSWLEGLRPPLIGVKDDPRVKKLVDYHTKDPVGRELFQGLLFRCGAHQSMFSDTLMQHGLPLDLIAVPMVESGCVLDAESPVGARGLWQFMPATARAYHLRVQAGVLDERLNPEKSTNAALEFLRDLRSKLGSWELAFASYNMGPFALVSRMNQAGAGVDFWDLVDAQRLPQETASYVPRIEAYALILANLEHFRFDAAQQMLESAASPMLVPAGTRVSQVARAVGSSASRLRELNPDLLADTVPGTASEEFSLRVPSDGAPRARELLERLVSGADDADQCVPANFDWGKQRLTKVMLSRCKR